MKKYLALLGAFILGAALFIARPALGDTINTLSQWISDGTTIIPRNSQNVRVGNLTVTGTCSGCGSGATNTFSGSGLNTQVTFWDSTNTLDGNNNFTFNSSTPNLSVTGTVNIQNTVSPSAGIPIMVTAKQTFTPTQPNLSAVGGFFESDVGVNATNTIQQNFGWQAKGVLVGAVTSTDVGGFLADGVNSSTANAIDIDGGVVRTFLKSSGNTLNDLGLIFSSPQVTGSGRMATATYLFMNPLTVGTSTNYLLEYPSTTAGIYLTGAGQISINNANPVAQLEVDNAAILATGTESSGRGITPVSGPSTRLMWIPNKAAFYAGNVDGSQWDDANIGGESAAFNFDNTCSGADAFCVNNQNTGSGNNSFVSGLSNTASAVNTFVAGGTQNTANSLDAAVIGGNGNTASNGTAIVVGGQNNIAAGLFSVVVGGTDNDSAGVSDYVFGRKGTVVNTASQSVLFNITTTPASVATSDLFVIMGGNVGIGTTNPTNTLQVNGLTVLASTTVRGKLTVTGAIDPTSLSLLDTGGTAAFIDSGDGQNAGLSAASHGRLRYNDSTHTWQQSLNGGAYTDIGSGGGGGGGTIGTSTANFFTVYNGANSVTGTSAFQLSGNGVLGTSITTTNLFATTSNFNSVTTTNLNATTALFTNVTTTGLSYATANGTSETTTNLNFTTGNGSTLILMSATTTNLSATLGVITTLNGTSLTYSNATTTNLNVSGLTNLANTTITNVTTTGLSFATANGTSITSTNLSFTTGAGSTLILTSETSTNLNFTTGSGTNLTLTSVTSTNGSFTTFFATNATTTNLNVTGLTNLANTTITNVTTTNLNVTGLTNLGNTTITNVTTTGLSFATANGTSITTTNARITNLNVTNCTGCGGGGSGAVGTSTINFFAFYNAATTVTGTADLQEGTNQIIFTSATGTSVTSTNLFVSGLTNLGNTTITNVTTTGLSFSTANGTSITSTNGFFTTLGFTNANGTSVTSTNLFATNATFTSVTTTNLHVNSTSTLASTSFVGDIVIKSTASNTIGWQESFAQSSSNPLANDILGRINFIGNDVQSSSLTYANIDGIILNPATSSGSSYGAMNFFVRDNLYGTKTRQVLQLSTNQGGGGTLTVGDPNDIPLIQAQSFHLNIEGATGGNGVNILGTQGVGTSTAGGPINITAGDASSVGTSTGADVDITGGQGRNTTGGNINLQPGNSTLGTPSNGKVRFVIGSALVQFNLGNITGSDQPIQSFQDVTGTFAYLEATQTFSGLDTFSRLNATSITTTNFNATTVLFTNVTTTGLSFTTANGTSVTTTNFFATNGGINTLISTNFTAGTINATSVTTTNLFATTTNFINATSTNFFATNVSSTGVTSTNLFVSNAATLNSAGITTLAVTTINGLTITPGSGDTLTIANNKTLTVNNSITFAGTDATTMTFPSSNTTLAGLSISQTFTGTNNFATTTLKDTTVNARFHTPYGAAITASTTLTLGMDGNRFPITGTSTLNAISTSSWSPGDTVFLIFSGQMTVNNNVAGSAGSAPLLLTNGINRTVVTNTIMEFMESTSSLFWLESPKQ